MDREIVDLLIAIYRLETVKAMYDQRIINHEGYKEYIMSIADSILEVKKIDEEVNQEEE